MMTNQKIVLKVNMSCDKCMTKAKEIAAVTEGVNSMQIDGTDRDKLVVTGVGIDTATLTASLRKKVGSTHIVSVEEVKSEAKKKEEEAKKKEEEAKKKQKEEEEAAKKMMVTWGYCNNYAPLYPPPPPPGCDMVCYGNPYPNSWFPW